MSCKKITGRNRQVCIGSLNKFITLKKREITEPAQDFVDFTENFSDIASVWANVKTVSRGEIIFDGTNTARQVSHQIYIRHLDITAEIWVEYEGKLYDILSIEVNINFN